MVLEATSGTVQPVGLTTIFFFAWLFMQLSSTGQYQLSSIPVRYQHIWFDCIIPAIPVIAAIANAFFSLHETTQNWILFSVIFVLRYFRLVVNLVAFLRYKPSLDPSGLTAKDVTVIIPTVAPYGKDFRECIRSVHLNRPAKIIIVTAGPGNYDKAIERTCMYPTVLVMNCRDQNKRKQICMAIPQVNTDIIVLCDDHVFWPSAFLPHILAPFQDQRVGCVGTKKRVRRTTGLWNFLGCIYLVRHNFEIVATNNIDGGVFVVSGRTSAHRTSILNDDTFKREFTNEVLDTWFGMIGPLNADDDNFITRWMVDHDWKIRIQYSEEACIQTTLGEYPKFLFQCMRWARTTWRSNPRSLLSRKVWETQPWCIYAVYLTSLFNFALLWDAGLIYMLPGQSHFFGLSRRLFALILWILCSKMVKIWPHFQRYPGDLIWLLPYLLFGYFHSGIKLWALVTIRDISWGSRPL